jgi:dipeptidyl aminopeptidase/acylaminoacyl peptidase
MNEFIQSNNYEKKYFTKNLEISVATFIADGVQTVFSVGETIGILFNVTINGLIQERDVDYYHVALTSKITFVEAPREGSIITITYYKGRSSVFTDSEGNVRQVTTEYFEYDGSTLSFTTLNNIDSVISVDINGLLQEETDDFEVSAGTEFTLKGTPRVGSRIGITYLY